MAAYEDFLPYVAPSCQGAPEPQLVRAIRDAAIEFCEKSLAVRATLDTIPSVKDLEEYEVITDEGQLVAQILEAWYGDREIAVVSDLSSNGLLFNEDTQFFVLNPVPSETGKEIKLRVALKPSRASTAVFDQLFEHYAETIGHGASARLMIVKGSAFYDPAEAVVEGGLFQVGINAALLKAARGAGNSPRYVKMRKV